MTNDMEDSVYPMRLNKYLAHTGVATRREGDVLIAAGKVFVNGKRAEVGMKVSESDSVEVKHRGKTPKEKVYFAFNKPKGVITHSPQKGEEDIVSTLPRELMDLGVFPIGRLDKDSHGLIILTNDGRITERLLSPESAHEKEYTVHTKFPLRSNFKKYMEQGVDIEGYQTKPARVRVNGEKSFTIILTEGKKHQIRRMVVAMHNEVIELKRIRVMNIRLGTLATGQARPIEGAERELFLKELGLV
jgi:23S rRNA pseudouridine2604 synthase